MSEFITATIIEKPELSADQFSYLDYSSETIAKLEAAVLSILEANGIDKDSVLFAGYSADSPKKTFVGHVGESDGLPIFYFGNAMSLAPPDSLWDDEDNMEVQWASNPFHFASSMKDRYGPHGRIAVYDKNLVHTIAAGRDNGLGFNENGPDEYGTYSYAMSLAELQSAKIVEIQLRDRVEAH